MKVLRTIASEALGLFVDDSGLAIAVVARLVLVWAGHRILPLAGAWQGAILFAGLAAILVGSALRRARR